MTKKDFQSSTKYSQTIFLTIKSYLRPRLINNIWCLDAAKLVCGPCLEFYFPTFFFCFYEIDFSYFGPYKNYTLISTINHSID